MLREVELELVRHPVAGRSGRCRSAPRSTPRASSDPHERRQRPGAVDEGVVDGAPADRRDGDLGDHGDGRRAMIPTTSSRPVGGQHRAQAGDPRAAAIRGGSARPPAGGVLGGDADRFVGRRGPSGAPSRSSSVPVVPHVRRGSPSGCAAGQVAACDAGPIGAACNSPCVVIVLGTAFFVAVEFALVAVDRAGIHRQAADGDRRAEQLERAAAPSCPSALRRPARHHRHVGRARPVGRTGRGRRPRPATCPAGLQIASALLLAVFQMVVGELVPKGLGHRPPRADGPGLTGSRPALRRGLFEAC